MRVSRFIFFCLLVIAPGATRAAAPSAADSLIRGIEARYNHAQTLSLHFEETFTQGRPHRPESGTLILRKPGRMRWDYAAPPGKVFVSDGKTAYLYTPQDRRVQRSSLKMSDDLRAPMAFLLGHVDLKHDFSSFEVRSGDGGTWLDARAKNDRVPYEKIELLVASDSSIRRLNVRGRDQSVLAFVFSEESLNPQVDDRLFRFTIPVDADVVDTVTTEQEN